MNFLFVPGSYVTLAAPAPVTSLNRDRWSWASEFLVVGVIFSDEYAGYVVLIDGSRVSYLSRAMLSDFDETTLTIVGPRA